MRQTMYVAAAIVVICARTLVLAQEPSELTLEFAIELVLSNSYRIKRLELDIAQTQHWLKARRAGLRSRVYANITAPDLKNVSDYEWDSDENRRELVQSNTMLWEGELSVRQPIILIRYPTNGYLSLNAKVNQFAQEESPDWNVNYYNRLYAKYEQPFFLPNALKNNLEDAQLNLDDSRLRYTSDRVGVVYDIARHFYWILELTARQQICGDQLAVLDRLTAIGEATGREVDSSMDAVRVKLEVANARESLLDNQTRLRQAMANMKQRLRLAESDSLYVVPKMDVPDLDIQVDDAVEKGLDLSPRLRSLKIRRRKGELRLAKEKGENAFHVRLEATYGIENTDEHFTKMWEGYKNSGSVKLNAYVPIVDWGERRARIRARELALEEIDLSIEEAVEDVMRDIASSVRDVQDYQNRTLSMKESAELARSITEATLEKYARGALPLQDVLLVVEREADTMSKLVTTYLGFRRALLSLMIRAFYDFENNEPLVDALSPSRAQG